MALCGVVAITHLDIPQRSDPHCGLRHVGVGVKSVVQSGGMCTIALDNNEAGEPDEHRGQVASLAYQRRASEFAAGWKVKPESRSGGRTT